MFISQFGNDIVELKRKLLKLLEKIHEAFHRLNHTAYLRNNMWPECGHKSGLWDDSIFEKKATLKI